MSAKTLTIPPVSYDLLKKRMFSHFSNLINHKLALFMLSQRGLSCRPEDAILSLVIIMKFWNFNYYELFSVKNQNPQVHLAFFTGF